jgi:hypothetical protein
VVDRMVNNVCGKVIYFCNLSDGSLWWCPATRLRLLSTTNVDKLFDKVLDKVVHRVVDKVVDKALDNVCGKVILLSFRNVVVGGDT